MQVLHCIACVCVCARFSSLCKNIIVFRLGSKETKNSKKKLVRKLKTGSGLYECARRGVSANSHIYVHRDDNYYNTYITVMWTATSEKIELHGLLLLLHVGGGGGFHSWATHRRKRATAVVLYTTFDADATTDVECTGVSINRRRWPTIIIIIIMCYNIYIAYVFGY